MKLVILILLFLSGFSAFCQEIDIKHLSLDIAFDWENKNCFGTCTIDFSTLKKTKSIRLDAGFLQIESITSKNQQLRFEYDGGDRANGLIIFMNEKCKPSELNSIQINYKSSYHNASDSTSLGGSFGKGLRFFEPNTVFPNKRKQLWSNGEMNGNKYWFPCNENWKEAYSTSIRLKIDKNLTAIANGELISTVENTDHTKYVLFEDKLPHPNFMTAIVVGEYSTITQSDKDFTIKTYCYPEELEAAKATVVLLPEMHRFLERKLGTPLARNEYSQIVVQEYPFPGKNGQASFGMLSENYIDDFAVHGEWKYLWDGVALQAFSTQWLGNLIQVKNLEENWLNAGFTQFLAGEFTKEMNGENEYLLYYHPFELGNVLNDWYSGIKHPIVSKNYANFPDFSTDNYLKFRGALVLRTLKYELGEDLFWKAIQHYVSTNQNKQVTTKDFIHSVNLVSNKSYDWFFNQWVYKVGLPQFELSTVYQASSNDVIVTIKQVQQLDSTCNEAQTKFYEGKIEVEINGKIYNLDLKATEISEFTIPIESFFKSIILDPNNHWICEKNQSKTKEGLLLDLEFNQALPVKLNAIAELNALSQKGELDTISKNKYISILLTQAKSDLYWRYRMSCIGALRSNSNDYSEEFKDLLLHLIEKDSAWVKASALTSLGNTNDPKYASVYITALNDKSDRVVNAAAIALGKTKSDLAFEELMKLEEKKSWKNQNRISALNGLKELGDERATAYALSCLADRTSPRWYLATPMWDYPYAAAVTLNALNKKDEAFEIVVGQLKEAESSKDENTILQLNELLRIIDSDKK